MAALAHSPSLQFALPARRRARTEVASQHRTQLDCSDDLGSNDALGGMVDSLAAITSYWLTETASSASASVLAVSSSTASAVATSMTMATMMTASVTAAASTSSSGCGGGSLEASEGESLLAYRIHSRWDDEVEQDTFDLLPESILPMSPRTARRPEWEPSADEPMSPMSSMSVGSDHSSSSPSASVLRGCHVDQALPPSAMLDMAALASSTTAATAALTSLFSFDASEDGDGLPSVVEDEEAADTDEDEDFLVMCEEVMYPYPAKKKKSDEMEEQEQEMEQDKVVAEEAAAQWGLPAALGWAWQRRQTVV